jgi:hypothetical protein
VTSRGAPVGPSAAEARVARRRSPVEVRWRQFRNAPRPVVRAVASSLVVAVLGGILYLAYDLAIAGGADLPGGDLRLLFLLGYVIVVLAAGSVVTWLIVPQPTGSGTRAVRSPWSAALGLFAAIPICYLVLVLFLEVIKPILTSR